LSPPYSSKKILVADPLMIQRKPLVHLLAKLGFPLASEAENGSQALILLKSEPHEGLICSPHLENPDGLSLLKRIRESPELGKLKVMMYFEDEDDDKIVSATRAGLDGYLVFPFKEKDLETMLTNIW
jgi:two-component system chemotaxis response regulator CheY|tara:strand:+ start:3650 stop:4030 length:381 start_codon:yes stop_codon:yes gene_type:complete